MTLPRPTAAPLRERSAVRIEDVRGAVRLAVDGVQGVTRIAEGLHGAISQLAPPLGAAHHRPARGIAGLVYRTVRGSSGLIGYGVDALLARAQALLQAPVDAEGPPVDEPLRRQVIVAALNGVLGDHLARTHNPLAIRMELVVRAAPGPRLLLLVHGLCMGDRQWGRNGHDHGLALAEALGCTPVYVRYNSGLHVSENGAELSAQLEELVARWPVPVESIAILGHSMGGLVARSAVHQAQEAGMAWPGRLRQMVFLGTPHHGAALERGGNWLHTVLGLSPYLAPFTRLGGLRSNGITDLRHGNLLQSDWETGRYHHRDTRTMVPLPRHVACHAIAGAIGNGRTDHSLGDGLVTVDSAFGRHTRTTHELHVPASQTWVARGVHHLELLSDPAVYGRLREWLGGHGGVRLSIGHAAGDAH